MDNHQEMEIKHQFSRLSNLVRKNGVNNFWFILFLVLMFIRGCLVDLDLNAANKKLDAILVELKANPVVVEQAVEVKKVEE